MQNVLVSFGQNNKCLTFRNLWSKSTELSLLAGTRKLSLGTSIIFFHACNELSNEHCQAMCYKRKRQKKHNISPANHFHTKHTEQSDPLSC